MSNIDNPGPCIDREARIRRDIADSKDPHASVRNYGTPPVREGKAQTEVRRQPAYGRKGNETN